MKRLKYLPCSVDGTSVLTSGERESRSEPEGGDLKHNMLKLQEISERLFFSGKFAFVWGTSLFMAGGWSQKYGERLTSKSKFF